MEVVQRTRVAAYGLAVSDSTVLLTRASERSDVPGTWWLPGGGVEFGEHPADAVVREFAEETGVEARVVRLIDVVSTVADGQPPHAHKRLHTLRVIYEVEVSNGALRAELEGSSDEAAWVALPEVDGLPVMPFFRPFIANL